MVYRENPHLEIPGSYFVLYYFSLVHAPTGTWTDAMRGRAQEKNSPTCHMWVEVVASPVPTLVRPTKCFVFFLSSNTSSNPLDPYYALVRRDVLPQIHVDQCLRYSYIGIHGSTPMHVGNIV